MVLSFLLTSLLMSVLVAGDNWDCADYYWRDYYGVIPDDAVPAGLDRNGDALYIGFVYVKDHELIPGTIFPKLETIRTSWSYTVYNTDQYVKILCSTHKEALDWITIESKDLHLYTHRNLIPGGTEGGEDIYIGRVYRDNNVIIGKVFRHESGKKGIWFPVEKSVFNILSYEILLFDCDKIIIPKFDVRSVLADNNNLTLTY